MTEPRIPLDLEAWKALVERARIGFEMNAGVWAQIFADASRSRGDLVNGSVLDEYRPTPGPFWPKGLFFLLAFLALVIAAGAWAASQ